MSARGVFTRRRFLTGAGGVAAAAVAAGVVIDQSASGLAVPLADLPAPVPGLPARQHAWDAVLLRDQYGNATPPRFDRLLLFDVHGAPNARYTRLLEAELRTLEHAHPWSPAGLLFTVGWSEGYFADVLKLRSPIPRATALSEFEQPTIDRFHLCLHLASDDEALLAACASQLQTRLAPILRLRQTRTGFAGAGLPAAHQRVGGIPGATT